MSAFHVIVASLPSFCQNYENWWKFDGVLTKTNVHSFLDTVYTTVLSDKHFQYGTEGRAFVYNN